MNNKNMREMRSSLFAVFHDVGNSIYQMSMGLFASLISFFEPTFPVVRVLVVFFLLDVVFGVWNARKNDGEKFQAKIIWQKTIPKMLVSFLLILTAHMLDHIAPFAGLSITGFVGWFICGVVLSSVWENFYKITQWGVIKEVKATVSDMFKEKAKKKLNGND